MAYVIGTENDDNLTIRPESAGETNYADGKGGNDTIGGSRYKDTLQGGEGNDTIRGNEGIDTIWGDNGNDRLIGGGNGDDRTQELIFGGNGDDIIYGDFIVERPNQNGGRDELSGGEGNDRLYGGQGDDNLMGGNGNDKLYGGSGDDLLRGDGGSDILQGGAGSDTFWFDNPSRDDGADVISDFTAGEDKIRLSGDYDDIVIFENQNATWLYSPSDGNSDAWYLMIENTTYDEVVESLFVYEGGQDISYLDAIG